MDLFKFTNPYVHAQMEQGQIVNHILTKMWIEKYRDASEFTLTARVDSDVRDQLPIGTYISHINSDIIMEVENHEITESGDKVPEVKITGRSLETFLENRIVGSNKALPFSGTITDYALPANYTWTQAKKLVDDHINPNFVVRPDDALPQMSTSISVGSMTSIQLDRIVKIGTVYSSLLELLKIDNLGVRIVRPGSWSPLGAMNAHHVLLIFAGVDKSTSVVFSYNTGEIVNADYLWSNKTFKNAAFVSGKWVQVFVPSSATEKQEFRRTIFVDGQAVDKDFTAAPVGGFYDACVTAMTQLGKEALANQNNLALSKAETRKDATKAIYRKDFGLGDLVTVEGDYDEARVMRVSEYVEIEDINGDSGYPTFTIDVPTEYQNS